MPAESPTPEERAAAVNEVCDSILDIEDRLETAKTDIRLRISDYKKAGDEKRMRMLEDAEDSMGGAISSVDRAMSLLNDVMEKEGGDDD